MKLRYRHYMKLTESELRNRLLKRKLPPMASAEIIRIVAEQKSELRVERGKNHQHSRMWDELMSPLKYERKVVYGLLKYQASKERHLALSAYIACLDNLVGKMTLEQHKQAFTPYQIAKANNRPNNGAHWTDWLSPSKKLAIAQMFDAIPYKLKAKKKLPFERVIPKPLWAGLHERLTLRTNKELDVAIRKAQAAEMAGIYDKIDQANTAVSNIKQAIVWIADMKAGEAVPVTWHGFF